MEDLVKYISDIRIDDSHTEDIKDIGKHESKQSKPFKIDAFHSQESNSSQMFECLDVEDIFPWKTIGPSTKPSDNSLKTITTPPQPMNTMMK
jgi:hypothetical protein